MKVSLALGPRRPLSRQTAWGCLTTNIVMPGAGSLLAGRIAGYPQLALAIGGTIVSLIFGVHFIFWSIANWSRLHSPEADPLAALAENWQHLKWALSGLGLFFLGWLWALVTSIGIVSRARHDEKLSAPPRLGGRV
jgi:hypothetical protein